jgi:malonyl CoA-acyl carrier protein transacylase
MLQIANQFERFIERFSFGPPTLPVISNVTARPYPRNSTSASVKSLLVRQIASPVRWADSIRHLGVMGATTFIETGPGKVLARLCEQIEEQDARAMSKPVLQS